MKVRKINVFYEFFKFSWAFGKTIGYYIPDEYFFGQNVWGLFEYDESVVGGFALVNREQRVIDELPDDFDKEKLRNTCTEITGYFIKQKKGSFKLTCRLLIEVLKNDRNKFIYAYPVSNKALQKYYGYGKPKLIFSGYPKKLHGHKDDMEEQNVEILTKFGVFKIFFYRTLKQIKRKIFKIKK